MNIIKNKDTLFIPYAIIVVFVILTIWSQSTSWLYYRPFMCDSAIFQVIGKYWALGEALPYSGLFDSKGPIIFLINAFGYALTKSKIGVFFIQLIFLSATTMIAYMGLRRYYSLLQAGLLATLIPLCLFTMTDDGNTVSEYLLPLLMFSFLLVESYLNSNKVIHPIGYSFIYGLTFGWCLMSRLTDFVTLGGGDIRRAFNYCGK